MRTIQFRRKREGRTDYRFRMKMLSTGKLRLVVRPTLKNIIAQLVSYEQKGDKVILGISSQKLRKYGWDIHAGNLTAAYLTGYLLGKMAAKNVKEAMLDAGLRTPVKGSKIYACVKGVKDAGIKVPIDDKVLPKNERIRGEHIKAADLYEKVKASIGERV